MDVGIIGAGAAASAAAHVIDDTTDASITILEKSGGVCGRAATRRRGPITYDHGANYFKDDDERVVDLVTETLDTEGLETIDDPVWVFDGSGAVSEGRNGDDRRWTYRQGLTQLAKRLLGQTGATVHRHTQVTAIERVDSAWLVTDADGGEWGPFDVLLCNPPAPQTAALLRGADWESPDRSALVDAVESVEYRAVWTAVLGYEFSIDRPYYGLVNPGKNHDVGWISREECKPGRVPAGQSVFIVQAGHDWSVEHYDETPAENVAELAEMTADVVGDDRLAAPDWTDYQGWRYALPENAAPTEPLQAAEQSGLYPLGDWVTGEARIHAALRNGLETGERVALAAAD
ncbi:MAG: renalase [Halovenus sp.]|jgi:renalase